MGWGRGGVARERRCDGLEVEEYPLLEALLRVRILTGSGTWWNLPWKVKSSSAMAFWTKSIPSSNRSRLSSKGIPKASYSRRSYPRPAENTARPPLIWSSVQNCSATATGWWQGRTIVAGASLMREVRAAR